MEQSKLVRNILINLSLLISSTMVMLWLYSSNIHTNISTQIKRPSPVDLWTEVRTIVLPQSTMAGWLLKNISFPGTKRKKNTDK